MFFFISTLLVAESLSDTPDSNEEEDSSANRKHSIIVAPGIRLSDSRDLVVSRLFRFGTGWTVKLGYEFSDNSSQHFVHLHGGFGGFHQNYSEEISSDLPKEEQYYLNLTYSSKLHVFSNKLLSLYLGWVLEVDFEFWVPSFLSYGWHFHTLVGPAFGGYWQTGPHKIQGTVILPVLGVQSRPVYNSFNQQMETFLETYGFLEGAVRIVASTAQFAFWHNFFRARLLLEYNYELFSFADLFLQYDFSGGAYILPHLEQSKIYLSHNINIGVKWRF